MAETDIKETLLYLAAATWNNLSSFRYDFTYGLRQKLHTVSLSFLPEDFPHLAGFQYLKDLSLPRYSHAKTAEKILGGKITQEMIEKGQQYEEKVKPRLLALASLDQILENPFDLYSFSSKKCRFHTEINADFLISSDLNGISFVFLVKNYDADHVYNCSCMSAFAKDSRDYRDNQSKYALMKKIRKNIMTSERVVLYLKPNFKDPEA